MKENNTDIAHIRICRKGKFGLVYARYLYPRLVQIFAQE